MICNVLFVCIGNICRSPMAEGFFAQAMPERMVCSAGLHAMVGHAADGCAIELMHERGIDLSGHRARQLASWMVREADLIVTMDSEQRRYIENVFPTARGKVRRLLEGPGAEVPDPYRHGRRAFLHSRDLIEEGIGQLVTWIVRQESSPIIGSGLPRRLQAAGTLPP